MNRSLRNATTADIDDPSASELSRVLQQLYQYARELDVAGLRQQIVRLLQAELPFDGAILGAATQVDGYMQVHDATIHGLPADIAHKVNLAGVHNIAGLRAIEQPGRALRFGLAELQAYPRMGELVDQVSMSQILIVATVHPVSRLVNFLSFARSGSEPQFSARDARWLELLVPHFETMLDMSRLGAVNRLRLAAAEGDWVMAATDVKGILHVAEPGFDQRLRSEWPAWKGPFLPAALIEVLTQQRKRYEGQLITAEFEWLDALAVVRLALRSGIDALTERERAVARHYAEGLSHKLVAQALDIAPATVRHHLRSIYDKLGIHDKAQLARHLSGLPK